MPDTTDTSNRALVRAAAAIDADAFASLQHQCFRSPWSADEWRTMLSGPQHVALLALPQGGSIADRPVGYVLARRVADEAEILSLAVAPAHRRGGVGNAMLRRLKSELAAEYPCRLFLEVSVENDAALALYSTNGFVEIGRRSGYYRESGRTPVDARVLACSLSKQ